MNANELKELVIQFKIYNLEICHVSNNFDTLKLTNYY